MSTLGQALGTKFWGPGFCHVLLELMFCFGGDREAREPSEVTADGDQWCERSSRCLTGEARGVGAWEELRKALSWGKAVGEA